MLQEDQLRMGRRNTSVDITVQPVGAPIGADASGPPTPVGSRRPRTMLQLKVARLSVTAILLFAFVLTLAAVAPSVAHPGTAAAQGVPPYCAPGYVSNGVICVSAGSYC